MSDGNVLKQLGKLRRDMDAEFDGVHDELQAHDDRLAVLESKYEDLRARTYISRGHPKGQKRSRRKPVT
jgi:hypothetical protein